MFGGCSTGLYSLMCARLESLRAKDECRKAMSMVPGAAGGGR